MSDEFNPNRSYYNDESRKAYENMMNRSIHGSRSSSKPNEYVPREKYDALIQKAWTKIKRAAVIGLAVGVMSTATVGVAVPKIAEEIHEMKVVGQELGSEVRDFDREIISPNTYRVNNNKDYAYRYDEIAKALESFGSKDFDKNVYICYEVMGAEQTSYVLDEVEQYKFFVQDEQGNFNSRSLRNYLYQHGMFPEGTELADDKAYDEALDNWKEVWENRIIIQNSIDEVENKLNNDKTELDEMLVEHNLEPTEKASTKGGL